DSIVRGTTSKQLVKLLREAGAKEDHMRISSPPFKFHCFYGIDISTRSDLMAANHTVEEMSDLIGADSLGFLSIRSLIKVISVKGGADYSNSRLTVAYFDGKYPTPLYDYEEAYLTSLKSQQEREEK